MKELDWLNSIARVCLVCSDGPAVNIVSLDLSFDIVFYRLEVFYFNEVNLIFFMDGGFDSISKKESTERPWCFRQQRDQTS